MALPSQLFRFRIDLSDVDRSVYEALDFRVAMHPSESEDFMLTRVLAYALNYEDGIEFSPGGLSSPDEPALRLLGEHGALNVAIEIGNPSARRLHKISKAAKSVRVYTYKDPENLKREAASEPIHRVSEIRAYSIDPRFLKSVTETLKRDNSWTLIHNEGELVLTIGEESYMSAVTAHQLGAAK